MVRCVQLDSPQMFRVCQGQADHNSSDTAVAFFFPCRMLEYSLDGHNVSLSAIRTVRVLRPLRAINRVPSKFHSDLCQKSFQSISFSLCLSVFWLAAQAYWILRSVLDFFDYRANAMIINISFLNIENILPTTK